MARGKSTSPSAPRPIIGHPDDPQSLYRWLQRFLQYKAERHYSPRTLKRYDDDNRHFITWADERGIGRPTEVTKRLLEQYQGYLYRHEKQGGGRLSIRSQKTRVQSIQQLFKWLAQGNHLLWNPASDLELPKVPHQLPKQVLSAEDVEQIIRQPDISTALGLRDRAILETFYSTGMRRRELTQLRCSMVDHGRGTVFIHEGKGGKDRVIPIGHRALSWVDKYQREARPQLTLWQDEGYLFVTQMGEYFHPAAMSRLVRDYIKQADIGKTGSCHLFRHTCATLMLENGADVRWVQALLGHSKLETTAVYTQVSIKQLKDVHTLTHPAKVHRDSTQSDSSASSDTIPI